MKRSRRSARSASSAGDLDPRDIAVGKAAEDTVRQSLLEKWNSEDDPVASLRNRARFARLYELLRAGNVEIKVVSSRRRALSCTGRPV